MDTRIGCVWIGVLVACNAPGLQPGQADAARDYAGLVPICHVDDTGEPMLLWADSASVPGHLADGDVLGSLVDTSAGPVVGCIEDGYRVFRRIPYAEPPTGDLRWRPPVAKAAWTEPLDATHFGPWCPQARHQTPAPQDEDCLSLTVWTPDPLPAGPLPVMVWVHGGWFDSGSGTEDIMDGAALARGDADAGRAPVILVTVNYRLGALGFLAHPGLTGEAGTSGDYGLMDQQLALHWVQDNIGQFGGDPSRVTLFGVSSGSESTCYHLLIPSSHGLFQRAIMQSGFCGGDLPLNLAEATGEAFAAAVGCEQPDDPDATVACLRSTPADTLASASTAFAWGPDYGPDEGSFFPEHSVQMAFEGKAARIPIMAGVDTDDGNVLLPADRATCHPFEWSDYEEYVDQTVLQFEQGSDPAAEGALMAAYPAVDDPTNDPLSPWWAASALATDAHFVCNSRLGLQLWAQVGLPAWSYEFDYGGKPPPALAQCPDTQPAGVPHASEMAFVFGSTSLGSFDPAEAALRDTTMGYWTRFAAAGDPNGGGAPVWPAYDLAGDHHQRLGIDGATTGTGLSAARCNLWDAIYFHLL